MILKTGFDTERLRKKLLFQKKYVELLQTYFQDFPEIADSNSPEFWDEKFANEIDEELFYMTIDRNNLIASKINDHCKKNKLIKKESIFVKRKSITEKTECKILNVGAGSGQLEKAALKKLIDYKNNPNFEWIGTDFTHKTLEKLRNNFTEFKFVKTDIENLPFPSNSFDVVCLLEVLEHIQPKKTFAVLKELHRVVKPTGIVFVSVPINEGLEEIMPNNPNSHVRIYSKKLLSFELQISGFIIRQIFSLTAFDTRYKLKKIINTITKIRKPNNLIFLLEKHSR